MRDVKIIPSPVGALGLFGRSPLTEEVEAELPAAIWDGGFTMITDGGAGRCSGSATGARASACRRRRPSSASRGRSTTRRLT